jgi:hypothetical protein
MSILLKLEPVGCVRISTPINNRDVFCLYKHRIFFKKFLPENFRRTSAENIQHLSFQTMEAEAIFPLSSAAFL